MTTKTDEPGDLFVNPFCVLIYIATKPLYPSGWVAVDIKTYEIAVYVLENFCWKNMNRKLCRVVYIAHLKQLT